MPTATRFGAVIAASLLLLGLAGESAATPYQAVDGDTLRIHGKLVRVWGIDAPEVNQRCFVQGKPLTCGQFAHVALRDKIGGQRVRCVKMTVDRYKRVVAKCYVGDDDLGAWMVRNGYALDYARYSQGYYRREQAQAQREGRGIWHSAFVAPWDWRHQQ